LSIKNISIIGLGLIGGSIAKALKYINSPIIIKGFDHPLVLDEAMNEVLLMVL